MGAFQVFLTKIITGSVYKLNRASKFYRLTLVRLRKILAEFGQNLRMSTPEVEKSCISNIYTFLGMFFTLFCDF